MYSEDLIRWLLKILIKTNKNFQIFNVGSDQKIGIVELANRISMIFKKKLIKKIKLIIIRQITIYQVCLKQRKT